MARRLSSLVLLLILAGGAMAATPMFAHGQNGMSAMKCCKKMRMNVASAQAAQLCCALNCSESTPTAPEAATNFSAAAFSVGDSIAAQIAALLERHVERAVPLQRPARLVPRTFLQHSYIQNHTFLI